MAQEPTTSTASASTAEDLWIRLVASWQSVSWRAPREAFAVVFMLIVVIGSGFSAISTYANVVLNDEDRFTAELLPVFTNEDVQEVVAANFVADALDMAGLLEPVPEPGVDVGVETDAIGAEAGADGGDGGAAGATGEDEEEEEERDPVAEALARGSGPARDIDAALREAVPGLLADGENLDVLDEENAGVLERAVRSAHAQTLSLVDNDAGGADSLEVDLGPIFVEALAVIGEDPDLAFFSSLDIPEEAGTITVLQRVDSGDRFWNLLANLDSRRGSTLTIIVLCGVLSLLLSPARTRIVWSIGVGLMAMAGLIAVGVYGTRAMLAVIIDDTAVVGAAQRIHGALLGDLPGRLVDMAVYGFVFLVVGLVAEWAWRRWGPQLVPTPTRRDSPEHTIVYNE